MRSTLERKTRRKEEWMKNRKSKVNGKNMNSHQILLSKICVRLSAKKSYVQSCERTAL